MPKYIFNKDTLNYEVYTSSGKLKFAKGIAVFAASVAVAFLYIWLYTAVLGWDLPKTAFLKKIRAKESASTAEAPMLRRAMGACSRLEP